MVTKEQAMTLWEYVFGNVEWAQDCFGTWMYKDAFGNEEVFLTRPGNTRRFDYSWNVDHIRPISDYPNQNDSNFLNNYEPMHRQNNMEKSNNYPKFKIEDRIYEIFEQTGYKGYGIKDISTIKFVDWKSRQNRHY